MEDWFDFFKNVFNKKEHPYRRAAGQILLGSILLTSFLTEIGALSPSVIFPTLGYIGAFVAVSLMPLGVFGMVWGADWLLQKVWSVFTKDNRPTQEEGPINTKHLRQVLNTIAQGAQTKPNPVPPVVVVPPRQLRSGDQDINSIVEGLVPQEITQKHEALYNQTRDAMIDNLIENGRIYRNENDAIIFRNNEGVEREVTKESWNEVFESFPWAMSVFRR